jgi:hypothetical protein
MAYINPYEKEQRRKAEQTELQRLYAQEEQGGTPASAPVEGEEPGVGRRAVDTVMDVRNNIGIGAWGSIEGMVDSLVLGPIGAVGGIFSPRFADTMKKAIQYNVTEDFLFKHYQKGSAILMGGDPSGEHSYLKDDGTVNSIARGIGAMLPAVAVSIATMGAATPAAAGSTAASAGGSAMTAAQAAKLAQTLSTATMAAGAAGQAEQEAYQDGADFYGGQAYGVLRGATEAATEYALGGTTKLITGGGKAMLPGVRRSVANVGIKRVVKAALEEGVEEGISEGLDPLTRTTYKGKEALAEYEDPAFYGRVLRAVKDGSLTGLVFQGTVGHAMGNTGKAADMREISDELDTLEKKRRNIHKNNALTDEAEAAIGADVRENYRMMEGVLKKATPEKRAALMEEHGLSGKFDENGAMKAEFSALLDRRATVGQTATDGENGSPAGSAGVSGGFDRRTASVDAEAEKVAKVLSKEGREQFTDVDSLSREGQKNLRDVKRVMEVFRDISDGAVGEFVIAKESVSDNAYFDPETGYTVIGADALKNGINVARKGVQSWFQTAIHEVTHGTEKTVAWFGLSNQLRGLEGGKVYNEMLKQLGTRGYFNGKAADIRTEVEKIARKLERGEALTDKQTAFAEDFMSESVAIMAEQALGNAHFARELLDADASVVEKLLHRIEDVKEALARRKDSAAKEALEEVRKAEQMFLDALAEKGQTYYNGRIMTAAGDEEEESLIIAEPTVGYSAVEDRVKHSYKSLAQAAGFEAVENEDGTRAFVRDGKAVSEVTVADIERSPIGAFINYSFDMGDITAEQAQEQKQLFAGICTMACKTNDFAMTMQFMGSAVFTGMKTNSDKQYGTTYDFPSICTKTQAMIDAMSARMQKLGRGMNKTEIQGLYNQVFHDGNPVPCPECYVFSRWVGIGGLLDKIKTYQERYKDMDPQRVAEIYNSLYADLVEFAREKELNLGKAKGKILEKFEKEYADLAERLDKLRNQGVKVKASDEERLQLMGSKKEAVSAMTWIKKVYFADAAMTKVNKRFYVPDDVLFDLNGGELFAVEYPEAWGFRTTQGAGYGKAITPYAEATLGEGVMVTNNATKTIKGKAKGELQNLYLTQKGKMNAEARKSLERARLRQKAQAFLGGQRFQSTSDARYENASDYLLAVLELQAMRGKAQVYTKVSGAVDAFDAWGMSSNQSLMPKGSGLDEDGNLIDTPSGGMSREVAFENRKKNEHAGTITIGVNDRHIRTMFGQVERDFIIPYHASGGDAKMIEFFRMVQDYEQNKKGDYTAHSSDYTKVQSEKVLSDDVLRWQGKTDAEIQRIKDLREARLAIFGRRSPDMAVVRSNRFLSALYDACYGGEWDGIKLAKDKVDGHIYPNEFWDKTVSYEDSGQITRDYLEYCEDLGYLHKFSGLVPRNGILVSVKGYNEKGEQVNLTDLAYKYDEDGNRTEEIEPFYWKVLTDRRMYGNDGRYLEQAYVTLNHTSAETVTDFARNNVGRQYDKAKAEETVKTVTSDEWDAERAAEMGLKVKKSRKTVTATPPEVDHLTPMQKQTVANYTRAKVYTKAEALAVVEDMAHFLDESYGFDGGMGEASGFVTLTKTVKDGAARKLWEAYNSAKTDGERRRIARELADLLMAEAKLVTLASDEELAEAREITAALGRYFHKIDLSGIAGEIKASGLDAKALRGRWGAKKGETAFTADQLKGEIEDKLGIPIPADNETDIFFWIDEHYRMAADKIGDYNKALLFGTGNGVALAEDQAIRDQIATEIYRSFKEGGKPSEWTKRLLYEVEPFYDTETEETGVTKAVFNASKALSFAKLNVHVAALSAGVKDWKAGVFLNQSQPQHQDIFKGTIGQLSKVNHGGRLIDPVKTRELIGKLGEWYTEETMKAMGLELNPEIAGFIKQIAEGEGGLTVADMAALESVIQYMKHTAETYQTVWMNGKRVKAMPVVREYVKIMQANQDLRIGKVDYILGSAYVRMYGDPHMIVRYMDKYKHGFYTEIYERLRQGAIKARVYRKRLDDQIAEVMDKYPKYFKELEGRRILLHGSDMPVAEAMSLWMSLNRDQAVAGILENGYCFTDDDPKKTYRRVFGFTGDEVIRDKEGNILPEYRQKIDEMQADIWEQLSEADRAYIGIVYKLLNQDCKKLKSDTDLARMGYTNAIEDFYFPIRRANSAQDIDQQTFFDEMSRVSNASFNKDTVKGAKNQLLIEPIQVVVNRHLRGVTMYAALGAVIDDYKMLKNLNVDSEQNHNRPVSVATEEPNTWAEGRKYFEQLMADIQGIKPETDELNKVVGKLRGNYAKFQLAANPKVIATQLSSLFAGMNIIDPDVMIYAFNPKVNGRDVYDYSELAEIRASENTAAMAQGLLDEAGDKLMAPIGWMDSWVVRRLWVASQHQVAKSGPKLGTEENKKAAAKLLDKVILETQQNALATEKSQAARSHSEIQKMLTMFTSDAVKGVGQLLDAVGEITVIRNEAKVRKSPVDTKRLAAAKRRAGRAAGSLAAVAVYGAILAAIIKRLIDRDEEWTWVDFLSEVGGGLLGGLPVIKEAYEAFWGSGYGMEDMSVAAVNDLMSSTKDTFEGLGALARGDLSGRDALRGGRNLLYSLGQVSGMPIRNAYTWSRRLVGIVVPDAAYKMENAFTKQPYASDIAKAIEREDEGRLETVIGVMLDENVGEVTSSAVRKEMKRLVVSGMDVLPRGVGDTVTVDGEAVKLTARQKTAFKEVYSEANKSVERMVGLAYYANASDEAKAKAIKRVYGIYYNRAIEDLLGVELENKNTLLSRAINPEVLAVVLAVCGEITADVGKDGKVVAGSKRKKVEAFVESLKLKAAQKYMIMGALGYKNKKGREKVLAYVNGLGLTKSEREAIMGYSGY